MDTFIYNGFWVLVGFLIGGGAAYFPLSKSISKVREDAVMKEECREFSELREKLTAKAVETLSAEISEVKSDVKEMRKELADIARYVHERTNP